MERFLHEWVLYVFKEIKRSWNTTVTAVYLQSYHFSGSSVCYFNSPFTFQPTALEKAVYLRTFNFVLLCHLLLSEGHVQFPSVSPCPICPVSHTFCHSPPFSFIGLFRSLHPAQLRVVLLFSVTDMFASIAFSAYVMAPECRACVGFGFSAIYQSVLCVPNRRKG